MQTKIIREPQGKAGAPAKAEQPRGGTAMRKKYGLRLGLRLLIFLGVLWTALCRPEEFLTLTGWGLPARADLPQLLWLLWMGEMVLKLRPARALLALGARKYRPECFLPAPEPDHRAQAAFQRESDRGAGRVLLVWSIVSVGVGLLARRGLLRERELFVLVAFFYLCDLICVVVWCPFRIFLMRNKCCTTCRIFNWDHMMMFVPFLFLPGLYGWSLVGMALVVLAVWERAWRRFPQRFWEGANRALRCEHCTDRLCGRGGVME